MLVIHPQMLHSTICGVTPGREGLVSFLMILENTDKEQNVRYVVFICSHEVESCGKTHFPED